MSFMKKILPILLAALLLQQVTPAQNTWTGSTNTNWYTGTNWSTGQAPTASDDVIIAASPNQPLIGTAGAVAKTVEVQSDAVLTISSSGALAVNGWKRTDIDFGRITTAFYNKGTVNNNGQLWIGNLSDAGGSGLLNHATFNNNTGGQITIDNSTYSGLENGGGSFTNAATLTIGSVASVGDHGLFNDATFSNTGGQITIDRSANTGLFNYRGTFTNAATITIGATAGVGGDGLFNFDE